MVNIARKEFNKYNPPFKVWFTEKILRKRYVYTVLQYTDFPVLFKKPKKGKKYYYYDEKGDVIGSDFIMSLRVRIFDLILTNRFPEGASFFFDEIQAKYDSMEYKDFPDSIAHYCQAHRHFTQDIYCSSQSQSRIIKRILVLSEEYWNVQSFKKFFGIAWVNIRCAWEMSANLESNVINEDFVDVDYFRYFFRLKKVGTMYDSKYLRYLQKDSVPYKSVMYSSLELTREDILKTFFPTEAEKNYLKNLRY